MTSLSDMVDDVRLGLGPCRGNTRLLSVLAHHMSRCLRWDSHCIPCVRGVSADYEYKHEEGSLSWLSSIMSDCEGYFGSDFQEFQNILLHPRRQRVRILVILNTSDFFTLQCKIKTHLDFLLQLSPI